MRNGLLEFGLLLMELEMYTVLSMISITIFCMQPQQPLTMKMEQEEKKLTKDLT